MAGGCMGEGVCVGTTRAPPLRSGPVSVGECPSVRPPACTCVVWSHGACVRFLNEDTARRAGPLFLVSASVPDSSAELKYLI